MPQFTHDTRIFLNLSSLIGVKHRRIYWGVQPPPPRCQLQPPEKNPTPPQKNSNPPTLRGYSYEKKVLRVSQSINSTDFRQQKN